MISEGADSKTEGANHIIPPLWLAANCVKSCEHRLNNTI